jgi:hypothetical protein
MKYILTTALILFGFLSYSQNGWVPATDSTEDNYYYQESISKLDTFKYVYQEDTISDPMPKTTFKKDVNGVMTGYIHGNRKNQQAVRIQEPGPTYNVVREYYGQYYPNPGRTWIGWIGQ